MSTHTRFPAKEYDLTQPSELIRLLRECGGYLRISQYHGGDFEGRRFAIDAIDKICNGEVQVSLSATTDARTKGDGK